jgi:hypothetical protein
MLTDIEGKLYYFVAVADEDMLRRKSRIGLVRLVSRS